MALSATGCFAAAASAAAEPHATWSLQTADTAIRVQAQPEGPLLMSLRQPGGRTWSNRLPAVLPQRMGIDAHLQPVRWRWNRASSQIRPDVLQLAYDSVPAGLRVLWTWRARAAYGPLEHTLTIRNTAQRPLWLALPASLSFEWQVDPQTPLQRFWVEKGADTPSAAGTHSDALAPGDRWEGHSSTYARPVQGLPREMIPYVLVTTEDTARAGWFAAIEFSGRTHITLARQRDVLQGEIGLSPQPAELRMQLAPGEQFDAPAVLLGTATGGEDGAANQLHRWVREILCNPVTTRNPSYPYTVSNSWGSGTAINDVLARRMISEAADLGLEMFHLDAGWFREVGDWQPDPSKFPHGVAAIADFAHAQRLKFGLWIDWTQAATSHRPGALSVDDPRMRSWLIAPPPSGWKHTEPYKGITIDLSIPAAADWAQQELEHLVRADHLDMLEHDGYLVAQGSTRHPSPSDPGASPDAGSGTALPPATRVYPDSGYLWVDSPDATLVSYQATRAYYRIYEQLRARHPQLLLEICNDGGRMVDLGSAAHGDYFSITDTYDPVSNRRAFYDASYVLPPAMLESYVSDQPTATPAKFRYLLRSGMLGWFSLMLDAGRWNSWQRTEARAQFEIYRKVLRPLIRQADLYHVSARPDGEHWDGIEYYSARQGRGVLYAFRGAKPDEPSHTFVLRGLEPAARYELRSLDTGSAAPGRDMPGRDMPGPDSRAASRVRTGAELMQRGVEVDLGEPLSSALLELERMPVRRANVAAR